MTPHPASSPVLKPFGAKNNRLGDSTSHDLPNRTAVKGRTSASSGCAATGNRPAVETFGIRRGTRRAAALFGLCALLVTTFGAAGSASAALVWGSGGDVWDRLSPHFSGLVWQDGAEAVFDGAGPMTVRVASEGGETPLQVGALTITASGYSLVPHQPGDRIELVGTRTLDIRADAAMSAGLSSSGGLEKLGDGRLALESACDISGTLRIAQGELLLRGAGRLLDTPGQQLVLEPSGSLRIDNASPASVDRLGSAGLVSRGGTLASNPSSAAGASTVEQIASLVLQQGRLKITQSPAASDGAAVLRFASVTRSSGGGTLLVGGDQLGLAVNRVELAGITAVNDIIPWAVVQSGAAYHLAKLESDGRIAPMPAAGYHTGSASGWSATTNARPSSTVTLTGNYSLNALVLDAGVHLNGPGGDRDINFSAGAAAILQTGGESRIINSSGNEYHFNFGSAEGMFHVFGTLTLQRGNGIGISGSGGITKTGPGTLNLGDTSGFNGFASNNTGPTTLHEGTLVVNSRNNASALGTGALRLAGGKLVLTDHSAVSFNRPTTVLGDTEIVVQRYSNGTGLTHTLGTLALGPYRLTVSRGDKTTSGQCGVTFGSATLNGDATVMVNNNHATTTTVLSLGAINDGGTPHTLTIAGDGTVKLATAPTSFVGTWRLQGGTLLPVQPLTVSGKLVGLGSIAGAVSINAGGTLDAGDGATPGTLTINNTLDLNSAAASIFGIASASSYDSVMGISALTYGGTLTVQAIGSPTWAAGQVFDLFGFSSYSGTFSTITLPTLTGGLAWKDYGGGVYFDYTTGQIEIISVGPAVRVWNGGGSDDFWTSGSNWVGGNAPVAGDQVVFAGNVRLTPDNDNIGLSVGGLKFAGPSDPEGNAGAFTLGGNALTVAGKIENNSTNAQTINHGITLAAAVNPADTGVVKVAAGAGTLTIAGNVGGTVGLIKEGEGTAALTATSNSFTGDTYVKAGTLQVAGGVNSNGTWADDTTVGLNAGDGWPSPSLVTLVTEHVRQDTLKINENGKVVITGTSGPSSTSVVNLLLIGDGSGGFFTGLGLGAVFGSSAAPAGPADGQPGDDAMATLGDGSFGGLGGGGAAVPVGGEAGGAASPVPEPATWALAVMALLALGYAARRRK